MQLFMSYSPRDKDFAQRLAGHLERRGVSVFDERRLRPGDEWSDVLRKQIEASSALILLVPSTDSPSRNTVWFEAGAAKALGKRVLAVVPPGRAPRELPTDLADIIVLDTSERPLDRLAATLAEAATPSAETVGD